jgi:hypothetical protein
MNSTFYEFITFEFQKGGLHVEGQIFHEPAQWKTMKAL